jgi:hypothetical protein
VVQVAAVVADAEPAPGPPASRHAAPRPSGSAGRRIITCAMGKWTAVPVRTAPERMI